MISTKMKLTCRGKWKMLVVTDGDWYDDGDCEYAVKGLGICDTVEWARTSHHQLYEYFYLRQRYPFLFS